MITTIKILQTVIVCGIVPVYWWYYGPKNFLWFSDIALLTSVVALWFDDSLLASTQALSVFVLEIGWTIDVLTRIASGGRFLGLSAYMFRAEIPLWVRLLSLFHLWVPWLLLWMVWRYGYDPRALVVQTIACWIILAASYFVSSREENINWVFGVGPRAKSHLPPRAYLVILMVVLPLCIYLPTHIFLSWLFHTPRL